MKLLNLFVKKNLVFILPAFFVAMCAKDVTLVSGGGSAIGNIVGKIRNADGTLAKGVSIRLIPSGFDPRTADGSVVIDSTRTDENGGYAFTLSSSGFFNLSANGMGKYSFDDSVYGSEKNQFQVKDDTLKPSGSIAGFARLQAGGDSRKIVILLMGTTSYATPGDSSGAFSIQNLAQGKYKLRLLALEKNYGILDTSVSVESGQTTAIPSILSLPFEGIPAVGPVTVRFDPGMIRVKLSWHALDTSNVAALYVFRNTGIEREPFAILGKTDTSFDDDVILFNAGSSAYGDTLRYAVAAVGYDSSLGEVSFVKNVEIGGSTIPTDTIPLSGMSMMEADPHYIRMDRNHNIYLDGSGSNSNSWIGKIDSGGRFTACYRDTGIYFSNIETGANGNVYVNASIDDSNRLIKFSPDLKLLSSIPLPDTNRYINSRMTSSGDGLIYLFTDQAQLPIHAWVLDSTLTLVRSTTVDDQYFENPVMHGDTIFIRDIDSTRMIAYDSRFNRIGTINIREIIDEYLPPAIKNDALNFTVRFAADGGRLYYIVTSSARIFLSFNSQGKLIKRIQWLDTSNLVSVFDGINRLYALDIPNAIYIYKINEKD